jgi:hypothetical protein
MKEIRNQGNVTPLEERPQQKIGWIGKASLEEVTFELKPE